jgi:hypothetical protein
LSPGAIFPERKIQDELGSMFYHKRRRRIQGMRSVSNPRREESAVDQGDWIKSYHNDIDLASRCAARLKPNDRFTVEFVGGGTLIASKVVLALGNFPPGDPKLRDQRFHTSQRYLTDPWAQSAAERLSQQGDILILGSGLTGLDLLLSLAKCSGLRT